MGRRSFRRRKGRVILLHSYLKKRKKTFICCFVLCLCYNLYFLFLLPEVNISYLVYLDVLLAFAGGLCVGADAAKHHREMQRQKGLFIMDGGHYGLEHIFMGFMEQYIRERIDSNLVIRTAPKAFPATAM